MYDPFPTKRTEEEARIKQEWEAAKAAYTGPITRCRPGKGLAPASKTKIEIPGEEAEMVQTGDNDEGKLDGKPRLEPVVNTHESALDIWESTRATGFIKTGGKHIAAGNLVSRRGYARIIPDSDNWMERRGEI